MRKFGLISLCLFVFSPYAAGDDALDRPQRGEPVPRVRRAKPLDESQQKAFKKLIENSECAYVVGVTARTRAAPVISRGPSPCPKGKKNSYHCYGTVYCVSNLMSYYIEEAMCWSPDGNRCPTAKECARSSFFDATQVSRRDDMPVLLQKPTQPKATR